MTERRYLPLKAELRAKTDGEGRTAYGLAIPYDSWSVELGSFREKITREALTRSLKEALDGERNIFAYWSHDNSIPLGSTKSGKLKLEDREDGLYFELDTTRMTKMQSDALADGDMQMSFGFISRRDEWAELEDGTYERIVRDLDLLEVSPVTTPAYPATEASLRSAHDAWKEANPAPAEEVIEEVREEEAAEPDLRNVEMLKRSLRAQLRARGR